MSLSNRRVYIAIAIGLLLSSVLGFAIIIQNGRDDAPAPEIHRAVMQSNDEWVRRLAVEDPECLAVPAHPRRFGLLPLHVAVQRRDVEVVRTLLEGGASPDARAVSFHGLRALHLTEIPEIARLLIAHGANVNALNEDGATPLHLAVMRGDEAVGKVLVRSGAEVNLKDRSGMTPLHIAARDGAAREFVRFLLESEGDADAEDGVDNKPIEYAIRFGHPGVAEVLSETMTELNVFEMAALGRLDALREALGRNGNLLHAESAPEEATPLHYAAMTGEEETAQFLLKEGADPNARQRDDETALHWASRQGHNQVVRVLMENGADPDVRSSDGSTALRLAAIERHQKTADILLDLGSAWDVFAAVIFDNSQALGKVLDASPNAVGENSALHYGARTPLHYAAAKGSQQTVELLLEHGADVNATTISDLTPLHEAARHDHVQVVRILLSHGAEVHRGRPPCGTPLDIASEEGHIEVARLLLAQEDTAERSSSAQAALFRAAAAGQAKMCQLLLDAGAKADVGYNGWGFPLHLAAANYRKHKSAATLELLIHAGADPCERDRWGRTPLQMLAIDSSLLPAPQTPGPGPCVSPRLN